MQRSDVLVALTWLGDTDLNGTVDATDQSRLEASLGLSGRGWFDGDTNYDGLVNSTDLDNLLANFGVTTYPVAPAIVKGDFGGLSTPSGIDVSLDGTQYRPDGSFNAIDVDAMLLALNDPDTYLDLVNAGSGLTAADLIALGDFGGAATPLGIDPSLDGTQFRPDGLFNATDVDAYLLALNDPDTYALIQAASRPARSTAVPEPACLGIVALVVPALSRQRRRA